MEIVPSQIGWSEMSGGYPKRFAEYGSHTSNGAPVSTEGRKTTYDAYDDTVKDTDGNIIEYINRRNEYNNPILTAEEAAVPTLAVVMGQDDDWQPTLLTEQAPVPANVTLSGATVSWDASNYALLWAVCLNGNVIAFTTEPTYTATKNGSYTVRAANEMGGLSATSEPVIVTDATGISVLSDADATKSVVGVEVYSIDGKRLSNLQPGLNIVRQKMSDGSMKTIKVFK
jgi:hypothetical protein